ncbi:MAG: 2-dehydro-3-deoxyglucarate aldolase [Actinobacteria bacterium]|nr:2-dehydro-3-deoxyglucarate aldolase [Actinomycetota bacterium]
MKLVNPAKQLLKKGQVALGAGCGMGTPVTAEIIAISGYDWVLIDNQHGTWDRATTSLACMGVRAGGGVPVARVPENDYYAIGRLLDEGVLGIIVPMVETRADAEKVAFASRFPPVGGRSIGFAGAASYGPDYMEKINDELIVAIQLESKLAIANAEAIMSVDGIDACWLGPADLAASIGYARNTPEHDAAVKAMIAACKKYGKAAGIAAGSIEQTKKWIAAGCTFISMGGDRGWVAAGATADLAAVRG